MKKLKKHMKTYEKKHIKHRKNVSRYVVEENHHG